MMPASCNKKRLMPSRSGDTQRKPRRRKTIACRRCHTQKIKCSGEQPCAKCQRSGYATECSYPSRDSTVKVPKSYLDSVEVDNRRLAEQVEILQSRSKLYDSFNFPQYDQGINVENPLVGEQAWFQTYKPSLPPIYIGEAACTAFASRLRQFIAGDTNPSHITRVEYTTDLVLSSACKEDVQWPELAEAQLLVRVALNGIGKAYHVVLKQTSLDDLLRIYQDKTFHDSTSTTKYFALFALGRAYSPRTSQSKLLPGTSYFARALDKMRTRPERPSIAYIETLVLLAFFSFLLDRRHTGYVLISDAIRYGVTIGLHHTLPETQSWGHLEREHRVRLFWTLYILDRDWSAKLGFPVNLADKDIFVDMPRAANQSSLDLEKVEFLEDTQYFTAQIHHARIVGDIIAKLYSLGNFHEPFLQRVQESLQLLRSWMQSLQEHSLPGFQLESEMGLVLRLSFNQAIIITARPVLFSLLKRKYATEPNHLLPNTSTSGFTSAIPAPLILVGEACIQAARDSYMILVDQWSKGHIPLLSPTHAHWLFSVALVLVISSLLSGWKRSALVDDMDTDTGGLHIIENILRVMEAIGNSPAAEYLKNLDSVQHAVDTHHTDWNSVQWRDPITAPKSVSLTVQNTLSAVAAAIEGLSSRKPDVHATSRVEPSATATTTPRQSSLLQQQLAVAGMTSDKNLHETLPQPGIAPSLFDPEQEQQFSERGEYDDAFAFLDWNLTGPLWAESGARINVYISAKCS